MKKSIIFLFFLLSAASLFSGEIKIIVLDNDLDIPLEGVRVTLTLTGQELFTDSDGTVVLSVPDNDKRYTVTAQLPGYDPVRIQLSPDEEERELRMSISGIIEGAELVVERSALGKTDEETGISIAMDSEDMENTANIGLVEDVMTAVKTLPGIGYTSQWGELPAIRGGDGSELAAILDGFYILFPYHWGGVYNFRSQYG